MKDWLKDRPGLAWLLSTLTSVLLVLLAGWQMGWAEGKQSTFDEMKRLDQEKVSYEFFDKETIQHQAQELRQDLEIASKADKSLVMSMDEKLDLILEKL